MKIGSAEEMVSAAPNLIGFTPEESVVIVALDADRSVIVTMRVDIGEVLELGPIPFASYLRKVLPPRTVSIVPIIYTEMDKADIKKTSNWMQYDDECAEYFALMPILVVNGGTWTFLECDEDCCGNMPVIKFSSIDAEFVGMGVAKASTRDDLLKDFHVGDDPIYTWDDSKNESLDYNMGDQSIDAQIYFAKRSAAVIHGEVIPSDKALLELSFAVRSIKSRDFIIQAIADVPVASSWFVYDMLARAYRIAPHEAIATVAGLAAFMSGDGARANIASDVAKKINPEYSLNILLHAVLTVGMPPEEYRKMVLAISHEEMVRV